MIPNFESLRVEAVRRGGLRMAIAYAQDDVSLEVAVGARKTGLAQPILLGEPDAMCQGLERLGEAPAEYELDPCASVDACAARAVDLARSGAADVILKGLMPTEALLKAVLDRDTGLRTDRLLSDVRLYDHPFKDTGFLGITDGGVTPAPTLEQKRGILENAVHVYHCLGFDTPRVAVLCATEKVSRGMPHTVEARQLAEAQQRGEITGCLVDGPLSLDLALSAQAAKRKGYHSDVAGQADLIVGPTIEASNAVAKTLVVFDGAVPGQVVTGAQVPILIPSRADDAEVKLNSLALATIVATHG
jgi:phosphate butyryltransferase